MTDRTSLTITDERRKLEDRCREELDDVLPATQYRSTLYDLALINLIDTLRNHQDYDGPPEDAKHWNTRVVRSHYSTSVETRKP